MPHKRTEDGITKQKNRHRLYENAKTRRFYLKKKEQDCANAIVKDHNRRDPVTGEVFFDIKLKEKIKQVLDFAEFRFEEEDVIQSTSIYGDYIQKVEPRIEWYPIGEKAIYRALAHQDNEILNRPISPCWWR